jgi:hypothetical protein
MADKSKPVSIRLAPAEIERLQARAYTPTAFCGTPAAKSTGFWNNREQ